MDQTPFDSLDDGFDLLGSAWLAILSLPLRFRPLRKSDVEVHA